MLQLLRQTMAFKYSTPTLANRILELEIFNPNEEARQHLFLFSESHLPMLDVTDSKGNRLHVLPTSLIPDEILKKAEDDNKIPIAVVFNEPLLPYEIETIIFNYIQAWPLDDVVTDKGNLICYAGYREIIKPVLEHKEASLYISIFLPDEYDLKYHISEMTQDNPIFTHYDESSLIIRWFPIPTEINLAWSINIPRRILSWLYIGVVFGFLNPLFAFFCFMNIHNIIISNTILLGTIAGIVAMRAWIFYSDELLDNFNAAYLVNFILNLFFVCFIGILNVFKYFG